MSDTPRTDAAELWGTPRYCEHITWEGCDCVVMPPEEYEALFEHARDLERELAAVTAERDEAIAWIRVVGEEIAIAGHRSGDRAETLAGLRCLRGERDELRERLEGFDVVGLAEEQRKLPGPFAGMATPNELMK